MEPPQETHSGLWCPNKSGLALFCHQVGCSLAMDPGLCEGEYGGGSKIWKPPTAKVESPSVYPNSLTPEYQSPVDREEKARERLKFI